MVELTLEQEQVARVQALETAVMVLAAIVQLNPDTAKTLADLRGAIAETVLKPGGPINLPPAAREVMEAQHAFMKERVNVLLD